MGKTQYSLDFFRIRRTPLVGGLVGTTLEALLVRMPFSGEKLVSI